MPGGGGIGRPLGPSGGRGGGGGGTGLPDGLIGGRGAARFCGASVAGAAAAVVAGGADAGLAGGAPTGVGAGADAAAGGATEGAAGAGAGAAGVGAAGGAVGRELIRREERAGISGDSAADDPGADVAGAPTRGGALLTGATPGAELLDAATFLAGADDTGAAPEPGSAPALPEPRRPSTCLPWPPSWPGRALLVGQGDAGPRRRPYAGRGRPGHPRWRMSGSLPRYPGKGPARGPLYL